MKKRRRGPRVKCQSIATLLVGILGMGGAVHAELPLGIFGGEGLDSNPYGGIFFSDGTVTLFSDFPMGSGSINSVVLNIEGLGLIGGNVDSNGYAAYVDSSGTLTPLTISPTDISSVSINGIGNGLISGSGGYVAQVFPDGTVTPLSSTADPLHQVSLNNANIGLIGGEGSAQAYAAFSSPDGTLEVVDIPFLGSGQILCVALNENTVGMIGGYVSPIFTEGYLAFVSPGNDPIRITVPVGHVQSVAINSSNLGLMGGAGTIMTQQLYAGYATQDGTFTDLFPSTSDGGINSVALNDSGLGLIGGYSGNPEELYAAFVHPDGSVNPLFPGGALGIIHSVALNDADVGIIGGETDSEGFIAVIAPNGTMTELSAFNGFGFSAEAMKARLPFPNGSIFNSVGLLNALASEVTPTSAPPYASVIYSQLAAGSALENRFNGQNRVLAKTRAKDFCLTPKWTNQPFDPNSIWIEPFGNLVYVQDEGKIPAFSNEIGGALLGYDRQGRNFLIGAALGYSFNYASFSKSIGHAKIQEEMGVLYSAFYAKHLWMGLALWGGLYQWTTDRHTLSVITSKGKAHGWLLTPHLEFASPWALDQNERYFIEPFVLADWVNDWQDSYTESGSSGLNLRMPNLYNSFLQSEAGLRFYERFTFKWGDLLLEEKASYVNQMPFDIHSVNTAFVGATSTFPIAIGSSKMQNLGSAEFLASFVPCGKRHVYGGFAFKGTANASYQSYFLGLFGGADF